MQIHLAVDVLNKTKNIMGHKVFIAIKFYVSWVLHMQVLMAPCLSQSAEQYAVWLPSNVFNGRRLTNFIEFIIQFVIFGIVWNLLFRYINTIATLLCL